MRGKYLPFLVLPLFALFLLLSPFGVGAKDKDEEVVEDGKKVILCHAKTPEDAKNGYNLLDVSKKNVFDKKDSEDGKGHDEHEMDIIPMFTYIVKEDVFKGYEYKDKKNDGTCHNGYEEYGNLDNCRKEIYKKEDVEKVYSGSAKWLLEAGKIVLENSCKFPELCAHKTEGTPGQWSEWMGADEDPLDGYRIRPIYAFDLIKYQLFQEEYACDSEERYDACDSTETKTSVSSWVKDTSGVKEIQTTTTTLVDSTDEEVICQTDVTTASRNISTGEVLGTTDEVKDTTSNEAVLGTTSVVLAETGASSNILVYVVQAVLMLSTLISGTLFVKKYII